MPTDWLVDLLQANDPLFPTGAYAHSFGLEEIVRLGLVRDEATLLTFLQRQIVPLLQNLELPYVRYAYEAALAHDIDKLCELNNELDAIKLCREAREASTGLGTRRLQSLLKLFPMPFLQQIVSRIPTPHHMVSYSVHMAVREVPLRATLSGYFYQTLAGPCSAALKLIRIGQDGVQRVLRQALEDGEVTILLSLEVPHEKAGCFNPLLEIAGMRHERAEERLFIS